MKTRLLPAIALLLLIGMEIPCVAQNPLAGKVVITHRGFDSHVFRESYVYIVEENAFHPIDETGEFEILGVNPGLVTLESYVPGFNPSFIQIAYPGDSYAIIPIELQVVEIASAFTYQELPVYIAETKQHMELIEKDTSEKTNNKEYLDHLYQSFQLNQVPPGADLISIYEFIRDLLKERDD